MPQPRLEASSFSSFGGSSSRGASSGQWACLLHIAVGKNSCTDDSAREFVELARAAGVKIRRLYQVRRARPTSKYFIGSGKAAEIRDDLEREGVRLLIISHDFSPAQERNLERLCCSRVLCRSGLILDIFSQRARSHEGKLQVELAQLDYLSTRLIRGWSHLERQKGGIGLRGPGEKQLETDRRLLGRRIARINRHLERIKSRRCLGRRLRRKCGLPTVALVGYTNAGKTTLFNRLTQSRAYAVDRLFATLDPMMRRCDFERGGVIVSDTVGFISNLPHALIEAFNATLLEVREAELLLHVVDVTAVAGDIDHRREVEQVLHAIGAADIPTITVFNKSDLAGCTPVLRYDSEGRPTSVTLSAMTGEGLSLLKQALVRVLQAPAQHYEVRVPAAAGSLRAFIYRNGKVVREEYLGGEGWRLQLTLADSAVGALLKQAGKLGCTLRLSAL